MSTDCLFCKMITGDIPTRKVTETDTVFAFHDIDPKAPTHVLVIHKTHTASLSETEDNQIFADLLGGVRDVAKELGLTDYRQVINNGPGAGQTVYHMHAHILGGRRLEWPPG